jgi:hypothetical protein
MIRRIDTAARNVWSRNTRYTPLRLRSNCTCSLAQEAVQIDVKGAGGGHRPACLPRGTKNKFPPGHATNRAYPLQREERYSSGVPIYQAFLANFHSSVVFMRTYCRQIPLPPSFIIALLCRTLNPLNPELNPIC